MTSQRMKKCVTAIEIISTEFHNSMSLSIFESELLGVVKALLYI